MKIILAALAVSAVASVSASAASPEIYMSITGKVQGAFKGESGVATHRTQIQVLQFGTEIASTVDPSTGQAAGKRRHYPIAITKEFGAASPQLFRAASTNEVLSNVTIQVYAPEAAGKEQLLETVVLTNAVAVDVKDYFGAPPNEPTSSQFVDLEDVSFTYQKITVTEPSGGITYSDDWTQ